MMTKCGCDFETGECQAPLGCEMRPEIERLRGLLQETIDFLAHDTEAPFPPSLHDKITDALYQQQRGEK